MSMFLTVAVILMAFEYVYIYLANKFGIVDRPHQQSSHRGKVVRGGGIIFYIAFLLWYLFSGAHFATTLTGLTLFAAISYIDDIRSVDPMIRLFIQFIGIFLMFYQTPLFAQPVHVIIILMIACVGMINIFNFMDGINGMTGGYSLVVALALLYVNEYQFHFFKTTGLLYVIISLLVFCFFNFRKRAICFAGDVGSLSIGFIIVFLILELALKAKSMSWLAFLMVYAVDGGMTILHRVILGENIMKPHKKHAYQIMANELGIPHIVVSGIYMGLQAACCVWYISSPGYLTLSLEAGILVAMYLLFMKKYYHLHVKKG